MLIPFSELKHRISELLCEKGLDEYCAEAAASCMVNADMYGVTTHGSVVLPSHVRKIEQGGYNLHPQFKVLKETYSFAVVDAENAIGFASATYCMNLATDRCRKSGLFTVFSRHSNAFGSAFCYPLIAARQGIIGLTCCNAPPAMAPIGGKEKLLGTNPFSVVFPTGNDEPLIIDMATSKVAKSKFLQAKRENRLLPDGWALDKNGVPTNDPDTAIQGLVCPMEGFKGYGLALIIDLLSGLVSGAGYQDRVGKFYDPEGIAMNVGQVFVAIDPIAVLGDEYYDDIKNYITRIRTSQSVEDGKTISIPGDQKLLHRKQSINDGGISITEDVAALLF